jgi:hypothetical protein
LNVGFDVNDFGRNSLCEATVRRNQLRCANDAIRFVLLAKNVGDANDNLNRLIHCGTAIAGAESSV